MYFIKEGFLPNMINKMFLLTNQLHSYNTINSNSFHIYYCRTNIRQFGIRFRGPKLFNSLPFDIQNTKNIFSFKTKLKNISSGLNSPFFLLAALLRPCACPVCVLVLFLS